jgi:predicted MFS family arabinose efflux permease
LRNRLAAVKQRFAAGAPKHRVITPAQEPPRSKRMSRGLIALFAIATGQAVASNYLAQPLLDTISHELRVSSGVAGLIVTTAQAGYAAGLILLLPLGDLFERRRLITTLAVITAVGLGAAALAPSAGFFMAVAGLVGLTSVMAQILVPFAATLSPDAERGRVLGTVMSGLLLGILLARTVSGLVAQVAGWRTVYWLAAALMLAQAVLLWAKLPTYRQHVGLSYPRLLGSVLKIARAEPELRLRAVYGALSFAAFSVLWTTLAFLLSAPPYGYGEGTIGLFGLVGAAGALTASVVGRFTDRGWSRRLTGVSALLLLVGYVLLWMGGSSLVPLLAGVVVLDIGSNGVHITNQSEIYRLQPEARSRVNAFYMTSCFVGAAAGSAVAAFVYERWSWDGVCALGVAIGLASLALWAFGSRERTSAVTPLH